MSPARIAEACRLPGFPRVSGDEPVTPTWTQSSGKFSPRERG